MQFFPISLQCFSFVFALVLSGKQELIRLTDKKAKLRMKSKNQLSISDVINIILAAAVIILLLAL